MKINLQFRQARTDFLISHLNYFDKKKGSGKNKSRNFIYFNLHAHIILCSV